MSDEPTEADYLGAHAVLRKALREVAPADRPPPPWHAGGPALVCPALDMIRISLWCSELLLPRAPAAQHAERKAIVDRVAAFLEHPKQEDALARVDLVLGFDKLSDIKKAHSASLAAAKRAASGAATFLRGKADLVHTSAAVTVVRAAQELALEQSPMKVRAFLEEIDRRLMIAEFGAAFRERVKREPPAAEVLFRAGDDKGKMASFIVRLGPGSFGFLGKLGPGPRPKWSWIEGTRDEVLANVPDTSFAAATARVASAQVS